MERQMQWAWGMPTQAIELERRAAKLATAITALTIAPDAPKRGHRLLADAVRHSEHMEAGYCHACASASPDEFTRRISEVAIHARRTKALLMLLAQLGYIPVPDIRELIIEARGLENILIASRNTAKKRQRSRANPRATSRAL
jgi:hypothetical protein